jgi:GntR family transcriptional regulator
VRPRELLGRRIRPSTIFRDVRRLTSFTEDIRAARLAPGARVLSKRRVATPRFCRLLRRRRVIELRRLRLADGVPVCIENTLLPVEFWSRLERADLTRSLYRWLAAHGERLTWSKELMDARMPTGPEARLLQLPRGVPVVSIARLAYDERGRACEFTENVLRADRYCFYFELRRERR